VSYRQDTTKPAVSLDTDRIERAAAALCAQRGWTTDAQFSAGVDALTDAQALAAWRAFLKALVRVEP
jgi:hypothetical protein